MNKKDASTIKYVYNCWLATKVAFFHELLNITTDKNLIQPKRLGKHQRIIDILARFENIGPSHMTAPNDEGSLGFGGECFPKDTLALVRTAQEAGSPLRIVESVVDVNNKRKLAMAERVVTACDGSVDGKTIAVLFVEIISYQVSFQAHLRQPNAHHDRPDQALSHKVDPFAKYPAHDSKADHRF